MKQRTARYSYYRTSFPTAVKCGNSAATQRERIEREDNSELRVASRHSTASWRFFLLLPAYFFFLSQSAPDAFLFTTIRYTFKALFFLSYQKGRENCSADLFSFVSPFPEANRSLIVKFRLGPVHHFLV